MTLTQQGLPMATQLKTYGERNTNTNYLWELVERNLDVVQVPGTVPPRVRWLQDTLPGRELVRDVYFARTFAENLGWKHACVPPPETLERYAGYRDDVAFVTITKNPYSWLLSLHRRPYHQYYRRKPGLIDFLQRPWRTIGRDRLKGPLKNPIELWNEKNRSYFNLDDARTLRLTTESTFVDPAKVIEEISQQLGIARKAEVFVGYEQPTKEQDAGKDTAYYQRYYLDEAWRTELSEEAVRLINASVDRELMERFGYSLIEPG